MNHIPAWFAMGHYGVYVWCTYGLVGVVLVAGIFHVRHRQVRTQHALRHWFNKVK